MTRAAKAPARLLIQCLGNPDRGDDGIGLAIAAAIAPRLPPGVLLQRRSADMLALIDDWAGIDTLVCVDAAASMGQPGRIHRVDLSEEALPRDLAVMSSHAFGLAEAVALAGKLGLAPKAIIVYAIEGGCFDTGTAMSAEAAAAVPVAAREIVAEAERLCHHSKEPAGHA